MNNVLLIDLSSIAHPLYHVCASDPDPNATSTKTVERVRALASGNPYVGVCVEGGRSFRKDLDPTYKANRQESDAALYHQIDLAIDILRADGFPILRAEGFEADDVIATAVKKLPLRVAEDDMSCRATIVSADKDLLQLVGLFVDVKSLKDGSILDAAAVEAKFNVRPDQMLGYLALVGDTSDNIKGCEGVGKVRAAGLLKKYGTLDGMFKALDNINEFTPALETAIREFQNRALGVCELLRLRTDAPIDIAPVLQERVPLDVATFGEDDGNEDMDGPRTVSAGNLADANGTNGDNSPPAGGAGHPAAGGDGREPGGSTDSGGLRAGSLQSGTRAVHDGLAVIDATPAPVEWERQLEPRNMAQMKALALDMFASKLFSQYGSAPAVMSTILAGRELGLPAMASLRAFHIVEGKPTMAADFIRALVLKSGVVEYFRCTLRTEAAATFVAKRKGEPEISLTFTIEDGRRAYSKSDESWAKSAWGKNPADMCVARAGAKLARLVAPDVVSGLYAREELE